MTASGGIKNTVVVVIDSLRVDRVGAYGSERNLTPTIDSITEEGTIFERAFSCINTTDPSITSLHTGKYPRSTVIHHGGLVTDEEKKRIEATEFVPELLSNEGIQTIAAGRVMGRWHPRGFSEYSWNSVQASETKISQKLKDIHPLLHKVVAGCYNTVTRGVRENPDLDEGEHAVDDFLTSIGEKPFYGFIHLMDTHAWYDADSDLVHRLLETYEYPEGDLDDFLEEYSDSPVVSKLLEPNVTEADYEVGLARLYARYDATVRQADQKVKRLVEGLKRQGSWDKTALLVLSDHGESLGEHGIYFDHHGLYDQTVRVPFIARIPGAGGQRVEDFVQIHDIGPTVMDLFCFDSLENADGRSLLGYFDDDVEPPEPRDEIFIEEAHTQRRQGMRTNRFKYIEHVDDEVLADYWNGDSFECGYCKRVHGAKSELYDLGADHGETENLAKARPEIVEEMRDRLTEFREAHSPTEHTGDSVRYDDEEEILKRLEELGYR